MLAGGGGGGGGPTGNILAVCPIGVDKLRIGGNFLKSRCEHDTALVSYSACVEPCSIWVITRGVC